MMDQLNNWTNTWIDNSMGGGGWIWTVIGIVFVALLVTEISERLRK